MKAGLFLVLLVALSIGHANPVKDLKVVGATEMNWLFWKIYDIQLLNQDGEYDKDKFPLALVIRYAREIESSMLLSSTVDEWQRQEITWKPQWRDQLQTIWPNVVEGDEIILRVDQDLNSHFFYNQEKIGTIGDAEFAPAFLAIWLSENTLKPDLRNRLIGSF